MCVSHHRPQSSVLVLLVLARVSVFLIVRRHTVRQFNWYVEVNNFEIIIEYYCRLQYSSTLIFISLRNSQKFTTNSISSRLVYLLVSTEAEQTVPAQCKYNNAPSTTCCMIVKTRLIG